MTKRDARQDDSWKVLRGEDAAFIREAACRTAYVCKNYQYITPHYALFVNDSPKLAGVCGNKILAEPLRQAVTTIDALYDRYAAGFMSQPYIVNPQGDTLVE